MTTGNLYLVDPRKLPPQLRIIIDIIGITETVTLLNLRGGRRTRIPQIGLKKNALDGILSHQSILALCKSHLSGQRLTLPKPDKIYTQIRNINILAEKGKRTKAELARKYKLTTRAIQRIWNE